MFGARRQHLLRLPQDQQVEIVTGVACRTHQFVSLQRSNSLGDVAKKVVEQGRRNIHLVSALLAAKSK
jgi:PTS system mannose-specific IIA component